MKLHIPIALWVMFSSALFGAFPPLAEANSYGLPPHASDFECRRLAETWYGSPEGRSQFPALSSGLSYDAYGRVLGTDGATGSVIEAPAPPDCAGRGDWFLRNWESCRAWVRKQLKQALDAKDGAKANAAEGQEGWQEVPQDVAAESRDKGPITGEGNPSNVPSDPQGEEIPLEVFGASTSPETPMAPNGNAPTTSTAASSAPPSGSSEGASNEADDTLGSESPSATDAGNDVGSYPYSPRDGETYFDPMGANDWGGRKAFIESHGNYGQTSMVDALIAKFQAVCPDSGQKSGFTFDAATGFYEILNAMEKGGYTFDDGRTGWAPLQAFRDDGHTHMNAGREIGIKKR